MRFNPLDHDERPRLDNTVIHFGKYKGQTYQWVLDFDPEYGKWLMHECDIVPIVTREQLYNHFEEQPDEGGT